MKNDKWLDLTNGVCWSIIFSLAAIIMSIVALADTHPRVLYSADGKAVVLGFDYIGVIVAILALLVTFLVAWQIYNSLSVKRRTDIIERNLNAQIYRLAKERKNIRGTSEMSKEYCQGIACLSLAMIQYYETLHRRLNHINRQQDKRDEELKQLVAAYVISAQAINHLVSTRLKDDFPIDLAEMSVQGLELAHKSIFHSYYLALWPMAFTAKDHAQCDECYKAILNNASVLGTELMSRITSVRNRREAFRKELEKREAEKTARQATEAKGDDTNPDGN